MMGDEGAFPFEAIGHFSGAKRFQFQKRFVPWKLAQDPYVQGEDLGRWFFFSKGCCFGGLDSSRSIINLFFFVQVRYVH